MESAEPARCERRQGVARGHGTETQRRRPRGELAGVRARHARPGRPAGRRLHALGGLRHPGGRNRPGRGRQRRRRGCPLARRIGLHRAGAAARPRFAPLLLLALRARRRPRSSPGSTAASSWRTSRTTSSSRRASSGRSSGEPAAATSYPEQHRQSSAESTASRASSIVMIRPNVTHPSVVAVAEDASRARPRAS